MERDSRVVRPLLALPLLERERELEVLGRALTAAQRGSGGLVVIDAHAGMGKSALLAEAAQRAVAIGVDVLSGRCLESERDYPMGVALQLFERRLGALDTTAWAELFVGPARKAESLFADGPPSEANVDFSVLHGLYSLTSRLAKRAPLFVCVDDVQWADCSSLRFLNYLGHRLDRLPVALVLARRPGPPEVLEELWIELACDQMATELRLMPLSTCAVDECVRRHLPDADDVFRRECHRKTQGNPFLLEQILSAVEARRAEATAKTAERIEELAPQSLLRWTLLQLRRLPPGCLKLARAIAILGDDALLHTAGAVAGLAPDIAAHCADVFWQTQLVDQGEPLRFVQPLLCACVYVEFPPAERAYAHANAARLLAKQGATPDAIAHHLLLASRNHDVWTVQRLREAAAAALTRGAPALAVTYLQRALAEGPPADLRVHVLLELGKSEALVGAIEAEARLEEALRLLEPGQKAHILCQLGWIVHRRGRLTDAAEIFKHGLDALDGTEETLADELTAGYLAAKLMDRTRAHETETEAEHMIARRNTVSIPNPPSLLSAVLAWRLFDQEHAGAIVPVAERITRETSLLESDACASMAFWHAVACLSWSDALELSESVSSEAFEAARQRGSSALMADARFARAWPRYWMGRLDESAADALFAIDTWQDKLDAYLPAAAYWLALVHIERGELEQAALVLSTQSSNEPSRESGWHSLLLAGRGRLSMAQHDFKASFAVLSAAGEWLEPLTANPAVLAWRSDAALAAYHLGEAGLARTLAEEELRLARSFGAPRPIGIALRAAGLVQGGEAGIALLRDSVAVLERSPAKLELARALLDLGAALRRAGHRLESRETLRRGLKLTESFGARALDQRGRDELMAAGARPRRQNLSGAESLTESERRVAEMAARGLTNNEIAEALFVTRKTVRFHLINIYRKLGVSRRDELSEAGIH